MFRVWPGYWGDVAWSRRTPSLLHGGEQSLRCVAPQLTSSTLGTLLRLRMCLCASACVFRPPTHGLVASCDPPPNCKGFGRMCSQSPGVSMSPR